MLTQQNVQQYTAAEYNLSDLAKVGEELDNALSFIAHVKRGNCGENVNRSGGNGRVCRSHCIPFSFTASVALEIKIW